MNINVKCVNADYVWKIVSLFADTCLSAVVRCKVSIFFAVIQRIGFYPPCIRTVPLSSNPRHLGNITQIDLKKLQ